MNAAKCLLIIRCIRERPILHLTRFSHLLHAFLQPWYCPSRIIAISCGTSPVKVKMIKWSSVYREELPRRSCLLMKSSPSCVRSLWPSVEKHASFLLLGNALKTMYLIILRITISYATSIFITITQEAEQIFF